MFEKLKKSFWWVFLDYNEKIISQLKNKVKLINTKEEEYQNLEESEFLQNSEKFKQRILTWESLDDILVEALATAKNWCRRLAQKKHKYKKWEALLEWNMIPYDVQLMWAIILHEWKIAEMKTWEWKTLVAALALYLNSLAWKWAHLVTVNEYLAERDSNEMWQLFEFLWLTVWVTKHAINHGEKRKAYACDITYWTNNEFWFDYLRDNMATRKENIVQWELVFVIVDEVDSILIDEARTPLIISAPADESTEKYKQYTSLVTNLSSWDHYTIDEKSKSTVLTEKWIWEMEKLLWIENIYTDKWFNEVHHIEQALKANFVFRKDKDYMIKDNKVVIIDEFTWRAMDWRRYSDGLHQAIEAKENVEVQRESKTLATITFQNFFRLYNRLAWMTGTALTEAEEFWTIYWLDTIVVPTNKPMVRDDKSDVIYKSAKWKYEAITKTVQELNKKGQPVLVWTVSVEKSEILSHHFKNAWVSHTVLNAKYHEKEAEIITKAWEKWAVTIATNMAWRGTDIKLWEWVTDVSGLFILWSERHESRRIDNQLRWRSWRQWDPWVSQFFISMDDDLMRIFGSWKMKSVMNAMWMPEDMPIENKMISNSIESAQKKVEEHHFDVRKHIVQYDDVINKHRGIIYKKRKDILFSDDVSLMIKREMEKLTKNIVLSNTNWIPIHEWDYEWMYANLKQISENNIIDYETWHQEWLSSEKLIQMALDYLNEQYDIKEKSLPDPGILRQTEKTIFLQTLDMHWMEHINNMQQLREATSLAGYWQRDPLLEYKHQAFVAFEKLLEDIARNTIATLFRTKIEIQITMPKVWIIEKAETNEKQIEEELTKWHIQEDIKKIKKEKAAEALSKVESEEFAKLFQNNQNLENQLEKWEKRPWWITLIKTDDDIQTSTNNSLNNGIKAWRNDPCPCWSWKKFKKCCW